MKREKAFYVDRIKTARPGQGKQFDKKRKQLDLECRRVRLLRWVEAVQLQQTTPILSGLFLTHASSDAEVLALATLQGLFLVNGDFGRQLILAYDFKGHSGHI